MNKTSGMQNQQRSPSKESLILLSVRNVSQATNVILSYEYDVRIDNKNMKFGVKAHHLISSSAMCRRSGVIVYVFEKQH